MDLLNDSLYFSRAINDYSATVTIGIAIFAWFLYRKHTKRRLKINVRLSHNANKFKEIREMHKSGKNKHQKFRIWDVSLINPGYHPVFIGEVGLFYRDWWLGKEKKTPISHEYIMGIAIKPSDQKTVVAKYHPENIESCPQKISGAYAIDKTEKVWRVCKRLKVVEHYDKD